MKKTFKNYVVVTVLFMLVISLAYIKVQNDIIEDLENAWYSEILDHEETLIDLHNYKIGLEPSKIGDF